MKRLKQDDTFHHPNLLRQVVPKSGGMNGKCSPLDISLDFGTTRGQYLRISGLVTVYVFVAIDHITGLSHTRPETKVSLFSIFY